MQTLIPALSHPYPPPHPHRPTTPHLQPPSLTGDHADSDARTSALDDGGRDFGSGWVQHASHADESDAHFVVDEFRRLLQIHLFLGHGLVDAA